MTLDYQKLLEENNKLMEKNEELITQFSDPKENQSLIQISDFDETTEATNTNIQIDEKPYKTKIPQSILRTGSLFDEIVSLRNINTLDLIDDEEFFSSKKNSNMKNRNLSLDYNPS